LEPTSPFAFDETLKYGVNKKSLWVIGETIDAKSDWENLVTWQIRGDWLILSPSGIPHIILPIEGMKDSGVYENILATSKKNGKEFK